VAFAKNGIRHMIVNIEIGVAPRLLNGDKVRACGKDATSPYGFLQRIALFPLG
jgi:hypothetical protein